MNSLAAEELTQLLTCFHSRLFPRRADVVATVLPVGPENLCRLFPSKQCRSLHVRLHGDGRVDYADTLTNQNIDGCLDSKHSPRSYVMGLGREALTPSQLWHESDVCILRIMDQRS